VLDPSNEFNVDRTLTKDDVQKLIRVNSQTLVFILKCVHIRSSKLIMLSIILTTSYSSSKAKLISYKVCCIAIH
jgi:hypothetical protein